MIDAKGNYQYIVLLLFMGLFMFRFLYGGGYGGSHMPMGSGHGMGTGTQNYLFIIPGLIMVLMFFLDFIVERITKMTLFRSNDDIKQDEYSINIAKNCWKLSNLFFVKNRFSL